MKIDSLAKNTKEFLYHSLLPLMVSLNALFCIIFFLYLYYSTPGYEINIGNISLSSIHVVVIISAVYLYSTFQWLYSFFFLWYNSLTKESKKIYFIGMIISPLNIIISGMITIAAIIFTVSTIFSAIGHLIFRSIKHVKNV